MTPSFTKYLLIIHSSSLLLGTENVKISITKSLPSKVLQSSGNRYVETNNDDIVR